MELLNKGVIKRVGDGSSINLWLDPWLPRDGCRTPITPRGRIVITKVAELLDPVLGSWDSRLIDDTFFTQDANLIKAIPVHDDIEDFWAWHPAPNGLFSVKTAYKLFRLDLAKPSSSGEASVPADSFNWRMIWNSPVTPQAKQFLWRLAHNSLPLRWNIQRWGMDIDTRCPLCQRFDEDGAHLFFKCKPVRGLWMELGIEAIRPVLLSCADVKEAIAKILSADSVMLRKCVALLFVWWRVRNKCNAGESTASPSTACHQIRTMADDFELHCKKLKKPVNPVGEIKWKPPEKDLLKINSDGSWDMASGSGGWGFVARDENGVVAGAAAGFLPFAQDALHAEAEACLQALMHSQSWGVSRIHLETDSLQLVQAIKGNDQDLARNGAIFREIKFQLYLNYPDFRISYCPRACNRVADAMAAHGAKLGRSPHASWMGCVPSFASVLVASDIAGLTV